jgi:glutathione S-transferase
MFKLYNNAYSTCSQKVRLVLAEKGIDWIDVQISFKDNEHVSPWYLQLNPNGVVPTLHHGETVVIDSSVIMEYLDEVAPEPAMSPRTPAGRAQLRAWLRYFEEVATPAVRFPSFNQTFLRHYQQLEQEQFQVDIDRKPLRKRFMEKMGTGGFSDQDLLVAYENIEKTAARMEKTLADGEWLLGGERPSIADCCVAPLLDRMEDLGHAYLWEDKPRVLAWIGRFKARPSHSLAFYEGARLSDLDLYKDLLERSRKLEDLTVC